MSTFTQILYHIVYSTKNRECSLKHGNREALFRYVWGVVRNKKGHLYRINGVEDHLHILSDLHPTVALADFIKDLKVSSSKWIKDDRVFPGFTGWQDGYGAFTHSWGEKDVLIEYIKDQQKHHATVSFRDEYRRLLEEAGIEFDERFLL